MVWKGLRVQCPFRKKELNTEAQGQVFPSPPKGSGSSYISFFGPVPSKSSQLRLLVSHSPGLLPSSFVMDCFSWKCPWLCLSAFRIYSKAHFAQQGLEMKSQKGLAPFNSVLVNNYVEEGNQISFWQPIFNHDFLGSLPWGLCEHWVKSTRGDADFSSASGSWSCPCESHMGSVTQNSLIQYKDLPVWFLFPLMESRTCLFWECSQTSASDRPGGRGVGKLVWRTSNWTLNMCGPSDTQACPREASVQALSNSILLSLWISQHLTYHFGSP